MAQHTLLNNKITDYYNQNQTMMLPIKISFNRCNQNTTDFESDRADALSHLIKKYDLIYERTLFDNLRTLVVQALDKNKIPIILKIRHRHDKAVHQEAKFLNLLKHPYIVKKMDFFEFESLSVLVMAPLEGICLIDYIHYYGAIKEPELKKIMSSLLNIIRYINHMGYIYMDMKPDNLIYRPDTHEIFLIDLEMIVRPKRVLNHHRSRGTELYASPEVINHRYKGPESQTWSLGITLFVMGSAFMPILDTTNIKHTTIINMPKFFSHQLADLITNMLNINPKKRFDLEHIINHPWMI